MKCCQFCSICNNYAIPMTQKNWNFDSVSLCPLSSLYLSSSSLYSSLSLFPPLSLYIYIYIYLSLSLSLPLSLFLLPSLFSHSLTFSLSHSLTLSISNTTVTLIWQHFWSNFVILNYKIYTLSRGPHQSFRILPVSSNATKIFVKKMCSLSIKRLLVCVCVESPSVGKFVSQSRATLFPLPSPQILQNGWVWPLMRHVLNWTQAKGYLLWYHNGQF